MVYLNNGLVGQKGFVHILFLSILVLILFGTGFLFYQKNYVKKEMPITPTSSAIPEIINSNIVLNSDLEKTQTYTLDELKKILQTDSKDTCIQEIIPLVHPFPGYRYQQLTGTLREDHIYDPKANVIIHLIGTGLVEDQPIEDFSEENRKDTYSFELYYDPTQNTCKISDRSYIFDWLLPQMVNNKAIELAKKEVLVQEFFTKYSNPKLNYVDWIEINRSQYTNNRDLIDLTDKKTVYVYLGLSGQTNSVNLIAFRPVLVDIKNQKVIIGDEKILDSTPK